MSANAGQPTNKSFLTVLIIVLLLGAAYLVYQNMQPIQENVPGVAKVPDNITPVSPEDMARGPQPQGYR